MVARWSHGWRVRVSVAGERLILKIAIFTTITLVIFIFRDSILPFAEEHERILTIIQILEAGDIAIDYSFSGRLESVQVGYQVLKDFPFGFFGSFEHMQLEMIARGYPTYPHNGFLGGYLVSGICGLVIPVSFLILLLYSFIFGRIDPVAFLVSFYFLFFDTLNLKFSFSLVFH